jgi:protein-disulfide isomerase
MSTLASLASEELMPADAIVVGNAGAREYIVEFFDVRCSACLDITPKMISFIRGQNRFKLVLRNYSPTTDETSIALADIMDQVLRTGDAPAYMQGLLENPPATVSEYVRRAQLVLHNPVFVRLDARARVERDFRLAKRLGIRNSPIFILLKEDGNKLIMSPFEVRALL